MLDEFWQKIKRHKYSIFLFIYFLLFGMAGLLIYKIGEDSILLNNIMIIIFFVIFVIIIIVKKKRIRLHDVKTFFYKKRKISMIKYIPKEEDKKKTIDIINNSNSHYDINQSFSYHRSSFSRQVNPNNDEIRDVQRPILEKDIEEVLCENPELLGEDLILVGNQYHTDIGFIDILLKDKHENYVVVELKRGKGRDKVVGQIQRYMTWVEENLSKGSPLRGIIVVKEEDPGLHYALNGTRFKIDIKTFFDEPPIEDNIKYCDRCGNLNRKSAKFCTKCQEKFWL